MNSELEKQKAMTNKIKDNIREKFSKFVDMIKPQTESKMGHTQPTGEYSVNTDEGEFVDIDDFIQEEYDEPYFNEDMIDEDNEPKIVPANSLEKGWFWHQFDDGSGSLHSPNDESYFSYDLSPYAGGVEYKENRNDGWSSILSIKFEDFKKYAENVIISRYLSNGIDINNETKDSVVMTDEKTNIGLIKEVENHLNQHNNNDIINEEKELDIDNDNTLNDEIFSRQMPM